MRNFESLEKRVALSPVTVLRSTVEVKDGMRVEGRRFPEAEWWLRRCGAERVVVHHALPTVEDDSERRGLIYVKDDSRFAGLVPFQGAKAS